ncbi:MAG: ice-binding family protein [Ginsengibacter sp.]
MKRSLLLLLSIFILSALSLHTMAQAPTLGTAGDFVLFTAGGAVTNTGNSFITGNVGTNTGAITGFGNVNGVLHTSDGATGSATADLLIAYNQLKTAITTNTHAPLLSNETLTAGVYAIAGNATLDGTLTLDANNDPNAVFIFKMDAAFATTTASQIKLINGAVSCNVFWKVEGMVSIAGKTIMRGTVIANNAAVDLATDVVVDGRILSTTGALTLLNSSAKIPVGCGSAILTGPAAPDLVSVGCYAIFSTTGQVTNSGITNVKGDVGTNSGLATGYDPLKINGMIHPIPDGSTAAAAGDLGNVYTYLNGRPFDIELLYPAQFGNDLVLTPHTYLMNAATSLTGTVFLNGEGNADAVFVIQIKGALSTGTYAKVVLTNGTQAKNVYWNVDGAVSIADFSEFKGTIIANNGAISLATGVNLEGRILSTTGLVTTNAVTVTSDKVCGALPVTLLYFRGKAIQQKVVLEWATANEENNNYFTIEKSKDAITFLELTKVKAAANGYKGDHSYTFTDEQPFTSTYYRISQTDIDGNQKWYNTINIKIAKNQNFVARHYSQGNTIYIQTAGAASGNGSIELFSMNGKKVVSKQIYLSGDNNTYQINQSLNKGIYILVIKSHNAKIYRDKILIQ